jgi:hypothetical protein
MIISHQSQATQSVENQNSDSAEPTLRERVAVLLAGYGEVQSYRFIAEAIAILDDVLTRMEAHQLKKTPQLRALHSW